MQIESTVADPSPRCRLVFNTKAGAKRFVVAIAETRSGVHGVTPRGQETLDFAYDYHRAVQGMGKNQIVVRMITVEAEGEAADTLRAMCATAMNGSLLLFFCPKDEVGGALVRALGLKALATSLA